MRRAVLALVAVAGAVFGGIVPAVDAFAADPTVTVTVTPASPHVGEEVTVSGDVTDDNGQPVAGAALSATRDDSDTHVLTQLKMADEHGHYSFTDVPEVSGQVTWTVTWHGTTDVSGHQAVTVTRKPTSLSLDVNDQRVQSGESVTLTAHLGSPTTDRTVSIYARPYGQSRELVERGTVDGSDDLKATYDVGRRTTFIAKFDGDDTYAPAKAKQLVKVRARVDNHLEGSYARSDGYRLYHVGDDAKVVVHLNPGLADVCLFFRAQRYYSGGWHTTAVSNCVRTNARGGENSEFQGRNAQVNSLYRVRAEWPGSRAALADNGRWLRLRFSG
jgi:hypothetical protein